ncbi:major facilitator transporter [Caballeronia terrestris]|jgi:hypothetical protein|uniref:Major facilitator transporter n=1 Tax=Caballeronia terrestris TaxID=1226301 RepID=A0A158GBV2_9BURK|nr:major facilitator transporter [Caballeronia terrestris]
MKPARALELLNFFVADVQAGIGPFLGVFLQARGWGTDAASQVATALTGAALGPAMAGMTLGIVRQRGFDRQFGRRNRVHARCRARLLVGDPPDVSRAAAARRDRGGAHDAVGRVGGAGAQWYRRGTAKRRGAGAGRAADVQGTGRVNVAQGVVMTVQA